MAASTRPVTCSSGDAGPGVLLSDVLQRVGGWGKPLAGRPCWPGLAASVRSPTVCQAVKTQPGAFISVICLTFSAAEQRMDALRGYYCLCDSGWSASGIARLAVTCM